MLRAAERDGFHLLITNDKNMSYQQNLRGMQIAVIVLGNCRWSVLENHVAKVAAAIPDARPGEFLIVEIPYPDE